MKYEIRKMQQGGGFATFTPVLESAPVAPATSSAASSKTSKESDDDSSNLLTKNLYSKLIGNGLVNDVNYFVDKIETLNSGMTPFTNQSTINSSLDLIKDFNRVAINKQLWDTTYKNAQELGGLGEVAVSKQGGLFVKDGDTFKEVSIQDFNKNKDKYNPMSVAELLRARQFNPNLVYNDSIFQVGETAVGTNKILDNIQKSIKLIGDYHKKTEKHYSKSDLKAELQALQINKAPTEEQKQSISYLSNLLSTPGDQYKVIQDIKSKKPYANEAFSYIMSSLTREERNKLEAVAAINGVDAKTMVAQSIAAGLSGEENISEISPEKIGAGEGEGSGKLTSSSNEELFFSGKLNQGEKFNWNDPSTGKVISLPITGKIAWTDGGKPTGLITLNQADKTSMAQYIFSNASTPEDQDNSQTVTFGGKPVSIGDKDKIVQEGAFARAIMPTNEDGTPNFNILKRFKEAEAEVKKHSDWSTEQVNDFYAQSGLPFVQIDKDRSVVTNGIMKPFMIGYGYTTSQASATDDNENIEKIPSSMEKEVDSALKAIYTAAKVPVPTTLGTWGTNYYKGIIAYPIRETAGISAAANKGNVFDRKYTMEDIITNLNGRTVQGSADLLNK